MKTISKVILIMMSIIGCNGQHIADKEFTSKRVSKTASFIVNKPIDKVFPLYGAFEERKWAPHWEPVLIYPEKEIIEEGVTFKIEEHGHHGSEGDILWIVTKYEPENYLIQYLVSTENRFWTITVASSSLKDRTKTTVTYTFTGLNEKGNELNKKAIDKMFQQNLQDWGEALNNYFKSSK